MSFEATREELIRRQNGAYKLIRKEWDDWVEHWNNEHSEENLYGLGPIDAIYAIHQQLNERGL